MHRALVVILLAFGLAAPPAAADALDAFSGAAGDWVVLFYELPEPVEEIEYEVDFELRTASPVGTPLSYWLIEPSAVIEANGATHIFGWDGPIARHESLGGEAVASWHGGGGTGVGAPAKILGFVVAAASSAAWTLSSSIVVDGVALTPTVASGAGATFGAYKALDVPAPMPAAGTIVVDATFASAGWTHLQIAVQHVEPIGIRKIEASFPGGMSVSKTGSVVGASAPLVGGSATSVNYVGAAGDSSDAAGAFTATIEIAEASIDAVALLVHLPWDADALPAPLQGIQYVEGDWPFGDL